MWRAPFDILLMDHVGGTSGEGERTMVDWQDLTVIVVLALVMGSLRHQPLAKRMAHHRTLLLLLLLPLPLLLQSCEVLI